MTTNDRIRAVRQKLGLTMESFGGRLGVSRQAISNIENGNRGVTNQLASAICREWNVNEEWLRTGEGPMFLEVDPEDVLLEKVGRMLAEKPDSFRRRLVSALMDLSDEDLEYVRDFCEKLVAENKKRADQ